MYVIPMTIVALYIVALYVVTWYAKRLTKGTTVGYLLAGRELPVYVVAVMLTGLAVGGASTIGVAEQAYNAGIAAGWYDAAWAAGAIIVGLVAAGRYRKLNVATIPELFEQYYSTTGRILAVIGQLVIQMVVTSLQYVAGGAILASLLPQVFTFSSGMLVTAVVFVGITLIGGLWAAGLTNLINVTMIYAGVALGAITSIFSVGGFGAMMAALPPQDPWFTPLGKLGFPLIAGWFVVMTTQAFSTQAVVQISFAAKDYQAARKGYIWGGILMIPAGFLSALIGLAARAKFPGINPTLALPKMILSLNPFISGFTLAGLWAADVSTACGLLLGSATLFVKDIWMRFIQPNMTDKDQLVLSRIVVLVTSLATYFMATSVIGIVKTLLIGLTLTTAYTTILLFTLFAPGLCRRSSATWTLLAGMIFLAIWQFYPAIRIVPHPIYLAWPICVATFLIVAAIDRAPARIPATVGASR